MNLLHGVQAAQKAEQAEFLRQDRALQEATRLRQEEEEKTQLCGGDYVPGSPLEAKIAETITGITEGREGKPKFAKIQLQFPKAADVFETIRATFTEIDVDGSDTIELSEITGALANVRLRCVHSLGAATCRVPHDGSQLSGCPQLGEQLQWTSSPHTHTSVLRSNADCLVLLRRWART